MSTDNKNLFSASSIPEAPISSANRPASVGAAVSAPGGAARAPAEAIVRQAEAGNAKLGRRKGPDPRLFGAFDLDRGRSRRMAYSVTRDDRMSPGDAQAKMNQILQNYGLLQEDEGVCYTFMCALFACHIFNGGSVLQPARSRIKVKDTEFDYADVLRTLGEDVRRFFRAYADPIREEARRILDTYDPNDPVSYEQVSWIRGIAANRGLQRYPDLAFDAADACNNLGLAELAALNASKRMVLSSRANAVDSMRANNRVDSADQFDSTNGERVVGPRLEQHGRV